MRCAAFLLTGACRHPQAMTIRGGFPPGRFHAVAMLLLRRGADPVRHGLRSSFPPGDRAISRGALSLGDAVSLPPGADAASQCRALGHDPAEVRHVVLSHFHGDHIAGLHAFPSAIVHCARAGLDDLGRRNRWRHPGADCCPVSCRTICSSAPSSLITPACVLPGGRILKNRARRSSGRRRRQLRAGWHASCAEPRSSIPLATIAWEDADRQQCDRDEMRKNDMAHLGQIMPQRPALARRIRSRRRRADRRRL